MSEGEGKKAFVNRHGHRADMNRIDLSNISVERDGEVPTRVQTEPKRAQPIRAKRSFKLRWSKRTKLIIAGAVVLLLMLPVIVGEVIAASYRSDASAVSGKLNKLISDKVLPSQQKTTINSSTIGEMSAGVDAIRSSTCAGGLLDNMATLYPRAKSAYDDCIKTSGQLSDLSTSLKKLEAEERYLESVLSATKTVTTPLTEPFAVIDAQQTNWVAARDAVKKLNPPNEWQQQHAALNKWVAAVADGWTALNAASGAQDKAKFEAAEKALNAGYEGIRNIVDELSTGLHATQNSITTARKTI
jgi:hypothetical protein